MGQEISTETREALRYSHYTRSGTWVGMVALLSIGIEELFRRHAFLHRNLSYAAGVMAVAGGVMMFFQANRYRRKASIEEILQFHRNPHYWGTALLASAAVVLAIQNRENIVPVRAKAPQVEEPKPVEIVWPKLRVTSVVLNGDRSSALVNGTDLWLGQGIQGVKLVGVTESNIVVESGGQQKAIDVTWETQ
jgi:hypothetical protein